MFAVSFDRGARVAVFLFAGEAIGPEYDADFDAFVRTLERFALVTEPGPPHAGICIVEPGAPLPDAKWRARIAEAARGFRGPAYYAMVTESPLMRTIVKAIKWMSVSSYEPTTHASFAEAVAWIEQRRGSRVPMFGGLLAEARAMAARGERLPPFPPM